MNLFTIAWKSVRQRRLASGLTALSIALGVMLMVLVLVISGAVEQAFGQRSIGYQLLVGPKGSDLQLVLSAVYRIQPPIENLPYMYYEQLKKDRRVQVAVPLAFGDVTEVGGFPIVGTTAEYFEHPYAPERKFRMRGKQIVQLFDAIVGAEVARFNNWDVGSQFSIKHGGADSEDVHDEKFTVVAVLEATGTANDRTVFLNLEGFYAIEGHEKPIDEAEKRLRDFYASEPDVLDNAIAQLEEYRRHQAESASAPEDHAHEHEKTPVAMKEVTAILVRTRSDFDAINLQSDLKKGFQAMAVNPIAPINRLMTNVLGNVQKALVVLTGMIILVSGISIFVSIYNSMSDRKKEIGIMRALGAQRTSVFAIVLAESAVLCFGGGVIGWLLGHGIAVVASPTVSMKTGLLLNPWAVNPWEFVLFPVMLILAVLVGFLPGMTAYKTNVADALQS
ncbi:MAG: ABC transporter permease [Planctomyces sp.]|nr:ABC transporter permease [Planctomyces sp.]